MKKLCVLIGEGKSEKSFLISLIQHKFNFSSADSYKNSILYKSLDENIYWVFPVPAMGITHNGGCNALCKQKPYKDSSGIIKNFFWLLGSDVEIFYYILADIDNRTEAQLHDFSEKIKKAFYDSHSLHKSIEIIFSRKEIEAWFLSGLNKDFPYLISDEKFQSIEIIPNFENISKTKELLDSVLKREISGNRQYIGNLFGEYLDISKAISKSPSINCFFESLKRNGLLDFSDYETQ
jgi:hypothetical protein